MQVLLSLGSNLGNRSGNLRAAMRALAAANGVELAAASSLYETVPWGEVDQPAFMNMAAIVETDLEPLELLAVIKAAESAGGREPGRRWGPRMIDIDIVLWGEMKIDLPELIVPHTDFRRRAFVLMPSAEIAGDWRDPETGSTVLELAAALAPSDDVRKLDDAGA